MAAKKLQKMKEQARKNGSDSENVDDILIMHKTPVQDKFIKPESTLINIKIHNTATKLKDERTPFQKRIQKRKNTLSPQIAWMKEQYMKNKLAAAIGEELKKGSSRIAKKGSTIQLFDTV